MNLIGQFLLYNLVPSILIGLFAWLVVVIALKYLPIHDPVLRLSFLGIPVIKSALVLLGLSSIMPWPHLFFSNLQANALPIQQMLPALFVWLAVLFLAYYTFIQQARQALLKHSYMCQDLAPRLEQSLKRVRHRYQQKPVPRCDAAFCTLSPQAPEPQLRVSDRLRSPTALIEGGRPFIIFPRALIGELSEDELDGIVAHELGHFVLRRNRWCSTTLIRRLILVSPGAVFVSAHLNNEEEMACDDIAVAVVGQPERYAETLLKSYRFARARSGSMASFIRPLPQLLGFKTQLTTRIERLLEKESDNKSPAYQYLLACFLWFGLFLLFFNGV